MNREFSAGGIVFNDKEEVLLINPTNSDYWTFPKGHPKEGQTLKEAALAEVQEEGGVRGEIIQKVGDSKYVYNNPEHGKTFKVVTLYLMKYLGGDPRDHDWEVKEAGWFPPEQALEKLSFKNDKELLKKAMEIKHGQF